MNNNKKFIKKQTMEKFTFQSYHAPGQTFDPQKKITIRDRVKEFFKIFKTSLRLSGPVFFLALFVLIVNTSILSYFSLAQEAYFNKRYKNVTCKKISDTMDQCSN